MRGMYILLLLVGFMQGCKQVGKAFSMPPTAVLGGLLIISFAMSHACITVPGTEWVEPILLWV